MTTGEQELQQALAASFDNFIRAFSAFDESVINKQLEPGKWTPVQVASHIILATDGVPDHTTEVTDRAKDSFLPHIRPWWEDLSQKFIAPKELSPGNEPRSRQSILDELSRVRQKDLDIIATKDLSMICADFELSTIGYLTRYEWLWFIEMHLNRHTFQLKQWL